MEARSSAAAGSVEVLLLRRLEVRIWPVLAPSKLTMNAVCSAWTALRAGQRMTRYDGEGAGSILLDFNQPLHGRLSPSPPSLRPFAPSPPSSIRLRDLSRQGAKPRVPQVKITNRN